MTVALDQTILERHSIGKFPANPCASRQGVGPHGQNAHEYDFMVDEQPVRVKSQVHTGLPAGESWIRTTSSGERSFGFEPRISSDFWTLFEFGACGAKDSIPSPSHGTSDERRRLTHACAP
jgi:hypothetical protein